MCAWVCVQNPGLIHPCFGDLVFVEECFPETCLLTIGQHTGEVRSLLASQHWGSSTPSLCLTLYVRARAELKPSFLQGKRPVSALSQSCRKSSLTHAFSAFHMAHLPSVKRPRCWGNETNMEFLSHGETSELFIRRTVAEKFIWATVADSIVVSGPSAERQTFPEEGILRVPQMNLQVLPKEDVDEGLKVLTVLGSHRTLTQDIKLRDQSAALE